MCAFRDQPQPRMMYDYEDDHILPTRRRGLLDEDNPIPPARRRGLLDGDDPYHTDYTRGPPLIDRRPPPRRDFPVYDEYHQEDYRQEAYDRYIVLHSYVNYFDFF